MSLLFAYLIAIIFASLTLLFFYFWEKGRYFNIILLTFLFRIIIGYINDKTAFLFGPVEVEEFVEYFERWQSISDYNWFDPFYKSQTDLELHKGAYVSNNILNGLIVTLSGKENLFPLRIYLISIGLWILIPLVKLSNIIFKSPPNILNVLIATNFPTWVRHSITVGRTELSMLLTVCAFVELYLLLFDKFTYARLFRAIFFNWLMVVFRNWFIAFTVCTIGLFLLIRLFKKGQTWMKILVVILTAQLIPLAYNLTLGQFSLEDLYAVQDFINNTDTNFGGSSYLVGIVPNTIYDVIWYIPLHGFYFLFSPMPWDVSSSNHALSSLISFFFLYFLILVLNKNIRLNLFPHLNKIFAIFFGVACILGAGVKNAGAAERWRTPMVLPLALLSLEAFKKLNKQNNVEQL